MTHPVNSPWRAAAALLTALVVTSAAGGVVAARPADRRASEAAPEATVSIVDDTGVLAVDVPAAWTQIDPAPTTSAAGLPIAQIIASTDRQRLLDGFDVPGIIYQAIPYSPDTAAGLAANYDFTGACTAGPVEHYSDAYFVSGSRQLWTSCGGGTSQIVTLFANPADATLSVTLLVQLTTSADAAALDVVLGSFWVAAPTSTYRYDDSGTVEVNVPLGWDDVQTTPPPGGTGEPLPTIYAAVDTSLFRAGTAPGMRIVATPATTDLVTEASSWAPVSCTVGAPAELPRLDASGVLMESSCNGLTLSVAGANVPGRDDYSLVLVLLTEPTDQLSRTIAINSFRLVEPTSSSGMSAVTAPQTPSAPSTPPPPSSAGGIGATRAVTDDTGVLTMSVPASWTVVSGASSVNDLDDGGQVTTPRLTASTGDDWISNWETSGVLLSAYPAGEDHAGLLASGAAACAPGPIEEYDDGYFVGLRQDFTGCGGVAHAVHIAATSADDEVTVWVNISVVAADEAAIDVILDSFNTTGEIPFYELTDSTGLITMRVPTEWGEWNVRRVGSNSDPTTYPAIWASTPGEGPTDNYVWYQAFPHADVTALAEANDLSDVCTAAGTTAWDDGYFVGTMRMWTECDGVADSRAIQVYADPPDRAFTAAVLIRLGTPASDDVVAMMLDSFYVVAPAGRA